MASIERRSSGRYQVKIRRRGYPAQSKTCRTRAEAEEWARSVEREMDRGTFVSRAEAERTTLYDALDRYEREVTPRKRGAVQELYRIRTLKASPLAGRTLASIRGADAAALRDAEAARGMAASSIVKLLALLSHMFETAQKEWGIEVDNPVRKIRKPKISNSRDRRLSPEEWRYLQIALDDPGDAVRVKAGDRSNQWTPRVVRWAVETAMRLSEIMSLDWQHVDLARQTAHLPQTKNGKARTVPLSRAAVALLENHGHVRRLRTGAVFPTSGSAIQQSYRRAVARGRRLYLAACAAAGTDPEPGFLEELTFHDLRHEATSRLADRLQMHELMRVTGHQDVRMLARYYHPRAEDLAKKLG